MRKISIVLPLFLSLVIFSIVPTGSLLREAKAQFEPGTPFTEITSSVDGFGATVRNGGATFSTSITFSWIVVPALPAAPPFTFRCFIDGKNDPCGEGQTQMREFGGLSPGLHQFSVQTTDASGRQFTTPIFSWTVASPLKTTITSSVDGDGSSVPNGGFTTSNAMTFTFTSTGGIPPVRYSCQLDFGVAFSCSSPVFFTNLGTTAHRFSLTAADRHSASNALFTWRVISSAPPVQRTHQLIQLINNMHLAAATDQVLDAQLNSAILSFQNNVKTGGCGYLNGFVTTVHVFLQTGRLTQTQASQLLQGVQSVESTAGC
jgi:hypothetical protein